MLIAMNQLSPITSPESTEKDKYFTFSDKRREALVVMRARRIIEVDAGAVFAAVAVEDTNRARLGGRGLGGGDGHRDKANAIPGAIRRDVAGHNGLNMTAGGVVEFLRLANQARGDDAHVHVTDDRALGVTVENVGHFDVEALAHTRGGAANRGFQASGFEVLTDELGKVFEGCAVGVCCFHVFNYA